MKETDLTQLPILPLAADTKVVWIDVDDGYFVAFRDQGPVLVLVVGALADGSKAALDFDHPNLAAVADRTFHFKHSNNNGRKWWTAKAGRDFYFAVPKERIGVVQTKGYSYVPVAVHNPDDNTITRLTLNVSGGTYTFKPEELAAIQERHGKAPKSKTGWVDSVGGVVHTHVGKNVAKTLLALAKVSLSPDQCKAQGITIDLHTENPENLPAYREAVAAPQVRAKWQVGTNVYLIPGYSFDGSQGPFPIETFNPKRHQVLCRSGGVGLVRVPYSRIDWTRTAQDLNIRLPDALRAENRIGPVLQYHGYQTDKAAGIGSKEIRIGSPVRIADRPDLQPLTFAGFLAQQPDPFAVLLRGENGTTLVSTFAQLEPVPETANAA